MSTSRVSFDYRRHLLCAVRGFQRGTSTARMRAERIVAACPHTKAFTIANIVWNPICAALTDSIIQDDSEYLERLERLLSRTSRVIRQGYFRYDVRVNMTPQELECYTKIQELFAFLARFPFANPDDALAEYVRRCADVEPILATLSANVSESGQDIDETVYHLMLREVATIALNIDIRWSMYDGTHLVPAVDYVDVSAIRGPRYPPDATNSIAWARKALHAIAGEDWLYLSWQLTDTGVQFASH